jgi:RimJ/RimL family protein N-acetyltransferase
MIAIRRARPDDVDFLLELLTHEEVEPFLARVSTKTRDALLEEIGAEPEERGRFVIEVDGERAGTMTYERVNRRSRIAQVGGLAVHPAFRGRRVADEAARLFQRLLIEELGFHRLQLEIYGFNTRAQAHAERAGWIREGVKRKAYLYDGDWVDSVLYGLVAEDLRPGAD